MNNLFRDLWAPIATLFDFLVYRPILNLIQLFYNWTGDIGLAFLMISFLMSIILWPLMQKTYVNGQKTRLLQPELQRIQEKFKSDPRELLMKRRALMNKHGINTATNFYTIGAQFVIVLFALYPIVRNIVAGVELNGIIPEIAADGIANFGTTAFGFLDITEKPSSLGTYGLLMPIILVALAHLQARYIFQWAPKPDIKLPFKPAPKPKNEQEKQKQQIADSMQKMLKFQALYVFPLFYLFLSYNFEIGLNIYFFGAILTGGIRQVFISNYYYRNADKLLASMINSDPDIKTKKIKDNSIDSDIMTDQEVPTKVLDIQAEDKSKQESNKKISVKNKNKIKKKTGSKKKKK